MTSQLYSDLPFPALSLIAVLDFYSTKEQGFYYLSRKWIKNIFISFSYSCIHLIINKKSASSFVYIVFNCLWTFSLHPRWKSTKSCFREQVDFFFFPHSHLSSLFNGGERGPIKLLTYIFLMVLAFKYCVLVFQRKMKYDIRQKVPLCCCIAAYIQCVFICLLQM